MANTTPANREDPKYVFGYLTGYWYLKRTLFGYDVWVEVVKGDIDPTFLDEREYYEYRKAHPVEIGALGIRVLI